MGDEADWIIEQMIADELYWHEADKRGKVEATDVAEELFEDAESNKKLKDLNKGVIEW